MPRRSSTAPENAARNELSPAPVTERVAVVTLTHDLRAETVSAIRAVLDDDAFVSRLAHVVLFAPSEQYERAMAQEEAKRIKKALATVRDLRTQLEGFAGGTTLARSFAAVESIETQLRFHEPRIVAGVGRKVATPRRAVLHAVAQVFRDCGIPITRTADPPSAFIRVASLILIEAGMAVGFDAVKTMAREARVPAIPPADGTHSFDAQHGYLWGVFLALGMSVPRELFQMNQRYSYASLPGGAYRIECRFEPASPG